MLFLSFVKLTCCSVIVTGSLTTRMKKTREAYNPRRDTWHRNPVVRRGTGPSGSHPLQLVSRRYRPKARSSSPPLDNTLSNYVLSIAASHLSLLLCIWNYINITPDECWALFTSLTFIHSYLSSHISVCSQVVWIVNTLSVGLGWLFMWYYLLTTLTEPRRPDCTLYRLPDSLYTVYTCTLLHKYVKLLTNINNALEIKWWSQTF